VSVRERAGRDPRRRQAHRARQGRSVPLLTVAAMLLAAGAGSALLGVRAPASRATASPGSSAVAVVPVLSSRDGSAVPATRPPVDAPRPTTGEVSLGRAASSGLGPPACTYDDLATPRDGYGDWATTLVDTTYTLPDDYQPPDLVPVTRANIGGWGLVRALVIDDLRALATAARDAGNPVAVQSAYRSRARQADVFAGWVATSGERDARKFSARPGHSEHQLGTALDLRAAAGAAPWSGRFGETKAGRWLARHAPEFGFVLSYPDGAEDRTCYGGEAWHIRYVGRDLAAQVEASGLTLREFLWRHDGSS
jgi:zinc D-Ala-D-Ala carboxypeptidase